MNTTNGFYKFYEDQLLYAPNFVESSDICLYAELKDSYNYPVGGWYWFDSIEDANAFFGR